MVEFLPKRAKTNIVGADFISARDAAGDCTGAYRMCHYGCRGIWFPTQEEAPQSLLFIISYLLFAHKTFHFCGTNSSSNRRVANSSLMPLM